MSVSVGVIFCFYKCIYIFIFCIQVSIVCLSVLIFLQTDAWYGMYVNICV